MTYIARSLADEGRYLDRPIWHALMTRQSHLCLSRGDAVMFRPEVSHFGATGSDGEGDVEAFAALVEQGIGGVALMQTEPFEPPSGTRPLLLAKGLQMVLRTPPLHRAMPSIRVLGAGDVPDMLRLVTLTEPGPFRLRTRTLGAYLGVRQNGRLIAMAGERLKLPGFTEISAVCVHPEYRGLGLARALVTALVDLIVSRNETPFLHLYIENHPARALYESLGFELRAQVHITMMESARASVDLDGERAPISSLNIVGVSDD